MDLFMPVLLPVLLLVCLVFFSLRGIRSVEANIRRSPVISRRGLIIAKRQRTFVRGSSTRTRCLMTFEFPDGSREEFVVPPDEYGLLVEGDQGTLHSQGIRFRGFEREQPRAPALSARVPDASKGVPPQVHS
ncbi:DUF2500 domain-containing protein [Archangium sp.]|jgi:hypothetical protein|uniref:DUF2500 domain-containing protein n=1 Tax=Archangium sp. TaxID=1872627 RepID=UPI002EDAA89A